MSWKTIGAALLACAVTAVAAAPAAAAPRLSSVTMPSYVQGQWSGGGGLFGSPETCNPATSPTLKFTASAAGRLAVWSTGTPFSKPANISFAKGANTVDLGRYTDLELTKPYVKVPWPTNKTTFTIVLIPVGRSPWDWGTPVVRRLTLAC